jgi:hypothetical protein
MKTPKKIIFLFFLTIFHFTSAQESRVVKKEKLGNFTYDSYYRYFNHYEVGEQAFGLCYKINGREQTIGVAIYFNNTTVLSTGNFEIDKKNKAITCTVKNLVKRPDFEMDSTQYIRKQNKKGFFDTISVIEYKDGKQNVLFKKY